MSNGSTGSAQRALSFVLKSILALGEGHQVKVFVDPELYEEALRLFRREGPREGCDMGWTRWAPSSFVHKYLFTSIECAMTGYDPDYVFIVKRYGSVCEPCDLFSARMAFGPYVHVTLEYL